jgi:hypothetical protein
VQRRLAVKEANIPDKEPKPSKSKSYLQWWKEEIKAGVRYRRIYGKDAQWRHFKNMYRGFWPKGIVPVNLIYSVGRSTVPQIYFKNPRVSVKAMRPGFLPQSMVMEQLDNYFIKELSIKYLLKSGILDCYLCGRGPAILGYDSEFGFNPSFQVDERMIDSGLTNFGDDGTRIEYTDNIVPGMPWAMRASPDDVVVPWGTAKWEEARWFAFRKMRTVQDVKEDPKYSNTTNLKGVFYTKMDGSSEGTSGKTPKFQEHDSGGEWVELWEVHDKKTGMVYVLSLDHDKFLRADEDGLQIDGLPAMMLGFNEDPDYFWWTPDARLIQVQQAEINDIRTMAQRHRRVALLKMIVDKNIPEDELNKLLDGDPKAVVRLDVGPSGDIRKMVSLLQSHVPPDLIAYAREVREDTRETIGFSRNQMGAFEAPGGRRTAHEVETVRSAAMIRVDERRDIVADYMEKMLRKINQIIFTHWHEQRLIDVIGPNGARYWVKFSGREIEGEFAYSINPEEAIPENALTRRQDALQFIQLAQQMPGANVQYLMTQFARQFDWLDHKMLFPQNEGAGRSPERALGFNDFSRMMGQSRGQTGFPGLGGG